MYHSNYEKVAQDLLWQNFGVDSEVVVDDSLPIMLPIDIKITPDFFEENFGKVIFKIRPEDFESLSYSGHDEYLKNLITSKAGVYFKCLRAIGEKSQSFEFNPNSLLYLRHDAVALAERIKIRLIRDTGSNDFVDNQPVYLKNKELLIYDLFYSYSIQDREKFDTALINASLVFDNNAMNDIFTSLDIKTNLGLEYNFNRNLVFKLSNVYEFLNQSGSKGLLDLQLKYAAEATLSRHFAITSHDSLINVYSYLTAKRSQGDDERIQVMYDESIFGKQEKEQQEKERSIRIYLSDDIHETLLTSTNHNEVDSILSELEEKIINKVNEY